MMQSIIQGWQKLEKTIGGLKFAVVIILLFALSLTIGTFQESTHGTEYANRLIYKSWWFMALQGLMFLSILFATLLRLPPKKRLYGFYVLHSGLLILFVGSFVTYQSGIDGQLPLYPGTPNRNIELPVDVLTLNLGKGKSYQVDLPISTGEVELNRPMAGLTLKRYLPYAGEKIEWAKGDGTAWGSGQYLLANDRFGETLTFSLDPRAAREFEPTAQLGPLSVNYLPVGLGACVDSVGPSQIIVWDSMKESCFTPESRKINLQTTKSGNRFFAFKEDNQIQTFFPDISPFSLGEDFAPQENSRFRSLSLKMFGESPNLLIFGNKVGFIDKKGLNQWQVLDLPPGQAVALPWMGFKLTLLTYFSDQYPQKIPYYETPLQVQSELTKGARRALEIEIAGRTYWVKDTAPLELSFGEDNLQLIISKKQLPLPFEFTLDRFKMDTNPGTMDPASYESFVSLFDGNNTTAHHVFMNNPIKHAQFTFYQASFFDTEQGKGSVLSVNYDPGRPLKYAGCLLFVFGCIWHFTLNPDKKKKSPPVPNLTTLQQA